MALVQKMAVTKPSRITLPIYAAHAAWLGIGYLADPGDRMQLAPGLSAARAVLPIELWGAVFLGLAVVMVGARTLGHRLLLSWALATYILANVVWAGFYAASLGLSAAASPNAPAWPLAVAGFAAATLGSILRDDRTSAPA